mgnify:CR=1 FL=1
MIDAFVLLCTSYSEKIVDDRGFVIWKGIAPAITGQDRLTELEVILDKIVKAFGLRNCPLLVQLIESDAGFSVIEFSARTGGCMKYRMIEKVSGFDVIKATVDLFEGKIPAVNVNKQDRLVSDEFIYCNPGVFDRLSGVDECIKNGWISEIYELKTSGSEVGCVKSSGDRVAALLIEAEDLNDYVIKHNNIASVIKVIDNNGNDMMRHDCFPIL